MTNIIVEGRCGSIFDLLYQFLDFPCFILIYFDSNWSIQSCFIYFICLDEQYFFRILWFHLISRDFCGIYWDLWFRFFPIICLFLCFAFEICDGLHDVYWFLWFFMIFLISHGSCDFLWFLWFFWFLLFLFIVSWFIWFLVIFFDFSFLDDFC